MGACLVLAGVSGLSDSSYCCRALSFNLPIQSNRYPWATRARRALWMGFVCSDDLWVDIFMHFLVTHRLVDIALGYSPKNTVKLIALRIL